MVRFDAFEQDETQKLDLAPILQDPILAAALPRLLRRNIGSFIVQNMGMHPACVPVLHADKAWSSAQGGILKWFVKDSSTNGTWVNDVRVEKGASMALEEGDVLRLSCGLPKDILE